MITDEMLSAAAEEVSAAMVASVPKQDHDFSPSFQRKTAALQRRAAHPVRYQILRQAAATAAALMVMFILLYAASPTVQAAVNGWVRTAFGSYLQYLPWDDIPTEAEYNYTLPEEFDGYTLLEAIDRGEDFLYVYSNKDGQMLFFEYIRNNDSSLFLDPENCIQEQGSVGKYAADIYISKNPENSSTIVWIDTDTNTLLSLSAIAQKEDLITFAEKVEKHVK